MYIKLLDNNNQKSLIEPLDSLFREGIAHIFSVNE